MRLRRSFLRVLLSALGLLIVFSGVSIDASAAVSGGRWMSSQEALQVFGNTFIVTYYNGTEYVDTVATYTGSTRQLQNDLGDLPQGLECLQYTAPVTNLNLNPSYITVQFLPQYSINDTSQIHTALFVYAGITSAAVPPYQRPDWRWLINGDEQIFRPPLANNDTQLDVSLVGVDQCFYVNVDYETQNTFSASSVRVSFTAPVGTDSGKVWLYLAPPYVSSDAVGSNGIQSGTTTSGQSGGGSVNLDHTNSLLSSIISALDGLVDSIAALFVPDEDYIDAVCDDLADMLLESFGGIESDMLTNCIADLMTHGSTQSITFPRIQPPGTAFYINERTVSLKPAAGSTYGHQFYETIALGIDLVATCLFINMLFNKLRALVIGEKVVEVADDVD